MNKDYLKKPHNIDNAPVILILYIEILKREKFQKKQEKKKIEQENWKETLR